MKGLIKPGTKNAIKNKKLSLYKCEIRLNATVKGNQTI